MFGIISGFTDVLYQPPSFFTTVAGAYKIAFIWNRFIRFNFNSIQKHKLSILLLYFSLPLLASFLFHINLPPQGFVSGPLLLPSLLKNIVHKTSGALLAVQAATKLEYWFHRGQCCIISRPSAMFAVQNAVALGYKTTTFEVWFIRYMQFYCIVCNTIGRLEALCNQWFRFTHSTSGYILL